MHYKTLHVLIDNFEIMLTDSQLSVPLASGSLQQQSQGFRGFGVHHAKFAILLIHLWPILVHICNIIPLPSFVPILLKCNDLVDIDTLIHIL